MTDTGVTDTRASDVGSSTSPNSTDQLRASYVSAIDDAQAASDRTMQALADARNAREVARDIVLSGQPLADLGDAVEMRETRASLADELADLERARHEAQRLLFRLLQIEGRTLAEIARMYGISRQLVSRLVNEPEPVADGALGERAGERSS
jgi:DNA-directed RNA polymerase specialized sigma subunit